MDFSREKNGYSTREVDTYIKSLKNSYENSLSDQKIRISDLKRELDNCEKELKKYKSKNSDISNALVVAVETAKQIENSSKNVYALEIKRIRSLYSKWSSFLSQLIKLYPEVGKKYDHDALVKQFGDKIDEIIKQNSVDLTENVQEEPIGIRNLISKMGGINARRPDVIIQRNKTVEEKDVYDLPQQPTNQSLDDLKNNNLELKIKPIANMSSAEKDNFNSLVDKFFNTPDEEENAYSKALIRQKKQSSGFDLKEALNPTEDLAQIMKDFDFFDDDKDDDK